MIVDVNEPDDLLAELKRLGADPQVRRLPFGDVDFPELGAVVERKAGADLFSSFTSGRLADQLRRCLAERGVVVLIVEGPFYAGRTGRLYTPAGEHGPRFEQVMLGLLSLSLEGVRVVPSAGLRTTAAFLAALPAYLQKDEHLTLYRPLGRLPAQVAALTSLGLTPRQARSLLDGRNLYGALLELLSYDGGDRRLRRARDNLLG